MWLKFVREYRASNKALLWLRPLNAEERVRSRASSHEICGGQRGNGTGVSPSTSVFPCLCDFSSAICSHFSQYCISWKHSSRVRQKSTLKFSILGLIGLNRAAHYNSTKTGKVPVGYSKLPFQGPGRVSFTC